MTSARPSLSLAVNTRNEEQRIAAAMESAAGVDEIVVADMDSTDRTLDICRAAGAKVISLPNYGFCEPGRQQVIDACSSDWVLVLDGDERLSPGGVEALRDLAAASDPATAAYRIPRPTFLGQTEIRGTGWSIEFERHPRFFRRDRVTWPKTIHSVPTFTGQLAELPAGTEVSIHHDCFDDLTHAWGKFNTYSGIEAAEMRRDGRCSNWYDALREAIDEQTRRYEPETDGGVSFALSFGLLFYRLGVHLKNLEMGGGLHDEPVPPATDMKGAWRAFTDELRLREVERARERIDELMTAGDAVQAGGILNAALARWGDSPELLVEASVYAVRVGATEQAYTFCERALSASPDHPEARATRLALDVATGRRPAVRRVVLGNWIAPEPDEVVIGAPGQAGCDIEAPFDQLPFAPASLASIRIPDGLLGRFRPGEESAVMSHLASLLQPDGRLVFVAPTPSVLSVGP